MDEIHKTLTFEWYNDMKSYQNIYLITLHVTILKSVKSSVYILIYQIITKYGVLSNMYNKGAMRRCKPLHLTTYYERIPVYTGSVYMACIV